MNSSGAYSSARRQAIYFKERTSRVAARRTLFSTIFAAGEKRDRARFYNPHPGRTFWRPVRFSARRNEKNPIVASYFSNLPRVVSIRFVLGAGPPGMSWWVLSVTRDLPYKRRAKKKKIFYKGRSSEQTAGVADWKPESMEDLPPIRVYRAKKKKKPFRAEPAVVFVFFPFADDPVCSTACKTRSDFGSRRYTCLFFQCPRQSNRNGNNSGRQRPEERAMTGWRWRRRRRQHTHHTIYTT